MTKAAKLREESGLCLLLSGDNAVFSSTVGRKHNLSPVDNNIFMQSCIERVI